MGVVYMERYYVVLNMCLSTKKIIRIEFYYKRSDTKRPECNVIVFTLIRSRIANSASCECTESFDPTALPMNTRRR